MTERRKLACYYDRQEVPFVESPDGRVEWKLKSGRRFIYEEGTVYIFDGLYWMPLTLVPNWQAGIQFSLGFDAGRTLRRLWDEVPRT